MSPTEILGFLSFAGDQENGIFINFCSVSVYRARGREEVTNFMEKIDEVVTTQRGQLQMVLVFLPTNDEYLYAEIKRKCYLEYGSKFSHGLCFKNRCFDIV